MPDPHETEPWQFSEPGPIDLHQWPEQLTGRVVEARPEEPHVQGYAVLTDLARHYGFAETLYASITGDLPDERTGRLFALALMSWTPAFVGDASVHAGIVARVANSQASAALGAVSLVLAEEAQHLVQRHAALFDWHTNGRRDSVPDCVMAEQHEPWVATLLDAARAGGVDAALLQPLDQRWTWDAARLQLLLAAGIDTPERVIVVVMAARFVTAAGEALAQTPGDVEGYAMKVPRFQYRDP